MIPDVAEPLEALVRRLHHVSAIAELIAADDDTMLGTAVRGVADMLDVATDQLEAILKPIRQAALKN